MLTDLTVKDFLNKVAGSDPVPGGGSIAALNGALASALAAMVANLTIGKKKYAEVQEDMQAIAQEAERLMGDFTADIDRDSDAYDRVFACFKMPKETDEEKAARSAAIQEATKYAAQVPLEVARPDAPRGRCGSERQPECRDRRLRGHDVRPQRRPRRRAERAHQPLLAEGRGTGDTPASRGRRTGTTGLPTRASTAEQGETCPSNSSNAS